MGRHSHLGSPEGMRAHTPARRRLRTGSLGAILLLCASFVIAVGDEPVSLTVKNSTLHVVSIVIADKTYSPVAAGAAVTYASSADSATVMVDVSYAPKQGVSGSAQRSFQLAHHTVQGNSTYIACAFNKSITAPGTGGLIVWNVTADTLVVR